MARRIEFTHPVSKAPVTIEAPVPDDTLWQALAKLTR
jgi:23S rRNA pseudouridine1911/1915/1917 synthase